jgi:nucleotide-binding universal stress UspA family protein
MFPFRKILFPADFSKRCEGAARAVRTMALQFDAEVTGLHIVEVSSADSTYEVLSRRAGDKMDQLVAQELAGCKVVQFVERGDPAQVILSYAHNGNFDLVMMPTHGYGLFRRFLLGSVTAKILHDASCPVWTCAHLETWPAAENLGIRNVLGAVDLGPRSAAVLAQASQIAERFQAKLIVAHVVPEVHWGEDWRKEAKKGIPEQIQKLLPAGGPPAEIEILEGSPATALPEALDRFNSDLIVMGRTRAPETGGYLGANAYAIIARSPCPVLSV